MTHGRYRALRQEASTGLIHQHPASVTGKPQFVQIRPLQGFTLAGLEWITVQRAQTQHGQLLIGKNATLYELDHRIKG
ncbi:hypothetical protein D3C81_2117130 [compost metagenome]